MFQHTATRRWLQEIEAPAFSLLGVSTHSHPKVAAIDSWSELATQLLFQHTATRRWLHNLHSLNGVQLCFNTQPPEGGCLSNNLVPVKEGNVSTHSHPKVAAKSPLVTMYFTVFQHTATRRWLHMLINKHKPKNWFQHTATRRWLRFTPLITQRCHKFQHTATRRWLLKYRLEIISG